MRREMSPENVALWKPHDRLLARRLAYQRSHDVHTPDSQAHILLHF
jgi:hypothetical protein